MGKHFEEAEACPPEENPTGTVVVHSADRPWDWPAQNDSWKQGLKPRWRGISPGTFDFRHLDVVKILTAFSHPLLF